MSNWNIKGPISGPYGDFYVYNDPMLEKGITLSMKQVNDPEADTIETALTPAGLKKIRGAAPLIKTAPMSTTDPDPSIMERIASALDIIALSLELMSNTNTKDEDEDE